MRKKIRVVPYRENLLRYLAQELYKAHFDPEGPLGLARITVLFPHRRPALYLRHYLREVIGGPFLSPRIYAIEDFDVAIGLDATLAEAYLGRGKAHFHLKEWHAALEDFEQALALNPDLADAHAWRGYLLSEQGEHEPALEALRQAVALDDADPWKHILLAQALLDSGNSDEAKIEYTAALSLEVRSIEAYVGRAMAQAEQGDFDAAQADLDSALDIAPYDPVALNGQAWFYVWYRHDHLDKAAQLARRAVAGAEEDLEKARYLHTLGWVYYKQGRYEEAAATLEEAAKLATIEGEVVYGEILEHLEEVEAAE